MEKVICPFCGKVTEEVICPRCYAEIPRDDKNEPDTVTKTPAKKTRKTNKEV